MTVGENASGRGSGVHRYAGLVATGDSWVTRFLTGAACWEGRRFQIAGGDGAGSWAVRDLQSNQLIDDVTSRVGPAESPGICLHNG